MKSAYTVVFNQQRHHQHSQFGVSEGANQQVVTVLELYWVSIRQHHQDGSQSTLPFVSNLHQHDLPHQLLVARLVWSTLRCLILWTAFFLFRLWVTETVMAGDAVGWHQYRLIQQNISSHLKYKHAKLPIRTSIVTIPIPEIGWTTQSEINDVQTNKQTAQHHQDTHRQPSLSPPL